MSSHYKKPLLCAIIALLTAAHCAAQPDSITLSDCYKFAEQNYPLIKRYELLRKAEAYSVENLQKGYLPQVSVLAQGSYQSAVTELPIHLPNLEIPVVSKDQYKAYAQVDQVLYDGGAIKTQQELARSNAATAREQLAADLFQLRARVNQLFFGAMLIDEQLKQNDLLVADLQLGLSKSQASVKNGVAFRSSTDLITAEILTVRQHAVELHAARNSYTDMLADFIGKPIPRTIVLIRPEPVAASQEIKRPELNVFDSQVKSLAIQNKLLTIATRPRLGLYVQGGFGRPALNMLVNTFQGYYIGGARLTWSPSSFYTLKSKRAELDINRSEIEVQKETFLFNTGITLRQQNNEIGKYQDLLHTDNEIIALRHQVKLAAVAQLENGVITSNDFLQQVNNEDRAKQNRLQHELQLLMAQYTQQNTTGNQH